MNRRFIFIFFIVAFINLSIAQSKENETALIIPSIDYGISDRFYKTLSNTTPKLTPVQKVVKGQRCNILIFLLKYEKDNKNKADVVYDIKILKPSGSEYFNQTNLIALNEVINNNFIMMAEQNLGLNFDPPDEFGKYQLIVTIKDKVNKTESKIIKTIELVENKKINKITNDESLWNWFMNYYDNPEPKNMIEWLLYYINSPSGKKVDTFAPVLGFTITILKDNQYLFPEFFNKYNKSELRTKILLLNILKYFEDNNEVKYFLNNLPKEESEIYNKIENPNKVFTKENIYNAAQLDALWGAFFASGRYEFILALINTLNLKKDNILVFHSAKWSIKSNYRDNYLVKSYCDYIFSNEKLSNLVKQELGTIVILKAK